MQKSDESAETESNNRDAVKLIDEAVVGDNSVTTFWIRVTPNAKQSELVGCERDGDKIVIAMKIAAPPRDGEANAEVVEYLSDCLRVRKTAVVISERTLTSRIKHIRIAESKSGIVEKLQKQLSI